jgi:hypothetical protein
MVIQFLLLLAVHWIGDFVLQTHWQASNKSKNNVALAAHVGMYMLSLMIGTAIIFGQTAGWVWFWLVNGAMHFATDWCTSRVSSRLFIREFESMNATAMNDQVGASDVRMVMTRDFNPHNFFVVIGFDQLIHQVTLGLTMLWLL